ncbi:MAG: hypothetical protein HY986_14320 [Candidatus Melainabacteria bacterium]|nr:hypothetical protein [Candidatus Melainabacteria bacterium]
MSDKEVNKAAAEILTLATRGLSSNDLLSHNHAQERLNLLKVCGDHLLTPLNEVVGAMQRESGKSNYFPQVSVTRDKDNQPKTIYFREQPRPYGNEYYRASDKYVIEKGPSRLPPQKMEQACKSELAIMLMFHQAQRRLQERHRMSW